MEYFIDLKFEDKNYNALVHFVATFIVKTAQDAKYFVEELEASFRRRGVKIKTLEYCRIDNDAELLQRTRQYHDFQYLNSTATIQIEQFFIENPDQTKNLTENMIEKFFTGIDSTAVIGKKYNIPVRAVDKESRNPLPKNIYYFAVQHLIPKT